MYKATYYYRLRTCDPQERRRKLNQAMRIESVKIHGSRDGRDMAWCNLVCSTTFCPCNLPAVANLRRRTIQRQATSFMLWIRWSPIHEDTPPRYRRHWWYGANGIPEWDRGTLI